MGRRDTWRGGYAHQNNNLKAHPLVDDRMRAAGEGEHAAEAAGNPPLDERGAYGLPAEALARLRQLRGGL